MTTHIFIVSSNTFKYHLEYMFAGTGSRENNIDFNNTKDTSLHSTTENMLVSMIADGCRIRCGDQIVFYLQQDIAKKIFEGKFFGFFKATQDWSFLDKNDSKQFLKKDMNKSLLLRTFIKPDKVYSEGVTEWEALDEIKNINAPHQMLWSLIYRKLKGNRGNTMITTYEAERLVHLIRKKNNRNELECHNKLLSFDIHNQKIICVGRKSQTYTGRKEDINILPRLVNKHKANLQFEVHLQAYITKYLGTKQNTSLNHALLGDANMEWLGNEVSCGVGMQRIDIMLSKIYDDQKTITFIEIKAKEATKDNIKQLQRYLDWIEQYYIPNRPSDIQPILLSGKVLNKESQNYQQLLDSLISFNNTNSCNKIKYIEFSFPSTSNQDPLFETVPY